MSTRSKTEQKSFSRQESGRKDLPHSWFPPIPLGLLRPLLKNVADHVASGHPELFARLGPHAGKRFLIDPENLPFVLLLRPEPENPGATLHRRDENPDHDARISGTFFGLFDMIDGRLDGDAMFFSRDLSVGGDIEAVVAFRNALDDLDGGAVDSIAAAFGPFSIAVKLAFSTLRKIRGSG